MRHKGTGAELARIEIENMTDGDLDFADYSIRFGVERGRGIGLYQRGIHLFPRKEYNVLALLIQALSTLSPEELKLENWSSRMSLKYLSGKIRLRP